MTPPFGTKVLLSENEDSDKDINCRRWLNKRLKNTITSTLCL